MSSKDKSHLDQPIEGHVYDGIQELNNPLPKWWLATFYATIIFAIIYFGYFEVLGGPSHDERLAAAMAKITAQQTEAMATVDESAPDVESLLADPEALAAGKAQFDKICLACHGAHGEGLIGPNLTDKYWIHGKGDAEHILTSFRVGYPEKGMPPWGAVIPAEDHLKLAAYVLSLQGTDPPNAKAPQGELVE